MQRTIENQPGMDSAVQSKVKENITSLIMRTVSVVIKHLNKFGACVIDDFLGEAKGVDILEEVLYLRKLQMFQVSDINHNILISTKLHRKDNLPQPEPQKSQSVATKLSGLMVSVLPAQSSRTSWKYWTP